MVVIMPEAEEEVLILHLYLLLEVLAAAAMEQKDQTLHLVVDKLVQEVQILAEAVEVQMVTTHHLLLVHQEVQV
jgi:hypothetical protein